MFAKWWRGPEGCEGMIIKRLFWDRDFLAHILIVEANFLVVESEMMKFIKPLRVRRLGARECAVARSRADLGQCLKSCETTIYRRSAITDTSRVS